MFFGLLAADDPAPPAEPPPSAEVLVTMPIAPLAKCSVVAATSKMSKLGVSFIRRVAPAE